MAVVAVLYRLIGLLPQRFRKAGKYCKNTC
jgi:hypothetical protein